MRIRSAVLLLGFLLGLPAAASAACPAKFELLEHKLTPKEAKWMRYFADSVVPQLDGYHASTCSNYCKASGCAGECLAAVAAWWSLKEGNFDPHGNNPFRQSTCQHRVAACARLTCEQLKARKKKRTLKQPISPIACFENLALKKPSDVCQPDVCYPNGTTWQVGLAAVQVPDFTDEVVAEVVAGLGTTSDALLQEVAALAKYKAGDPRWTAIVTSTGVLRRSWLLRHPVVGTILVERTAGVQCVDASYDWCYGTVWDQSRWYAPTAADVLPAITELRTLFSTCRGVPTTTTTTTLTSTTTVPVNGCADIFDCNAGAEVCCNHQCKPNPYAGQSVCSTLYTPACTLCRTDDDCHCNPAFPIFCDSCGGGESIFSCVNPCS